VLKKKSESAWDIRMISPDIVVRNDAETSVRFHLKKYVPATKIDDIYVDEQLLDAKIVEDSLSAFLESSPNSIDSINIIYKNNIDLAKVDIARTDKRVSRLRKIADIRDTILGRTAVGRWIVHAYYNGRYSKKNAMLFGFFFLLMAIGGSGLALRVRRARRNK
jgi:hypothetical protein